MERELILRDLVCPDVAPVFDVAAFAEALGLGVGENTVRIEDISITEWEDCRLQVLPERLQLGFKPPADGELVRRVTEEFLTRREAAAPRKPVDFNSVLILTLEEGEDDPSRSVVDAQALAESLGGEGGRGGLTLVYRDDLSRWWIELSPAPDQDGKWTFDFNRHFASVPQEGEQRNAVLDWFADAEADLLARFEIISGGGK